MKIKYLICIILIISPIVNLYAGGGAEGSDNRRYLNSSEIELWREHFGNLDNLSFEKAVLCSVCRGDSRGGRQCISNCRQSQRYFIRIPAESHNRALIDNILYKIYLTIKYMQGYFITIVPVLAIICFTLMAGTGAVKVILGAEDLRKYLVKCFYILAIYFVFVYVFPIMTEIIFDGIGNMAAGAVSTAYDETNNPLSGNNAVNSRYNREVSQRGNNNDFVKFVNDFGGYYTIEDDKIVYKGREWDVSNNILKMDIRNEHNFISLDKTFSFILRTFEIMWKTFTSPQLVEDSWDPLGFSKGISQLKFLPWTILGFVCCIFYLIAMGKVIVEYFGSLIQFTFLRTVGLILIPLMIWEGSKTATEKLTSSLFNIALKLLISQIIFYLMLYTNVEILYVCYMWTLQGEIGESVMRAENYANFIVMAIMIYWIAKGIPAICDLLSGTQSNFGIHEFKLAANAAKGSMALIGGAAATGASMVRSAVDTGAKLHGLGEGAAKAEYQANQEHQIKMLAKGNGLNVKAGRSEVNNDINVAAGLKAVDKNGNELVIKDSNGFTNIDENIRNNFWADSSGNMVAKRLKDRNGNIINQKDPRDSVQIRKDNKEKDRIGKRRDWESTATAKEIGKRAYKETLFGKFGRPQDGMAFKILKHGVGVYVNNKIDRNKAIKLKSTILGAMDGENDNFHNNIREKKDEIPMAKWNRSSALIEKMDEGERRRNMDV